MRKDIVSSLKNSKMLFVRKLLGSDPMAVYKWSILRHLLSAIALFKKAGEARRNGMCCKLSQLQEAVIIRLSKSHLRPWGYKRIIKDIFLFGNVDKSHTFVKKDR